MQEQRHRVGAEVPPARSPRCGAVTSPPTQKPLMPAEPSSPARMGILQTPALRFAFRLQLLPAQEMNYTSSPYLSPSLSQVAGSESQMKYVSIPHTPLHLVLKQ